MNNQHPRVPPEIGKVLGIILLIIFLLCLLGWVLDADTIMLVSCGTCILTNTL